MALIKEDGIHHAKGIIPWKDVEKITLWHNEDYPFGDLLHQHFRLR